MKIYMRLRYNNIVPATNIKNSANIFFNAAVGKDVAIFAPIRVVSIEVDAMAARAGR